MYHFKGEKRALRDRRIRLEKEWKRWYQQWVLSHESPRK